MVAFASKPIPSWRTASFESAKNTVRYPWERGTSENANGLIRQYLPKKSSMVGVSQWECNAIAKRLNRRPRKILNLSTPEQAHYGLPRLLHF